MSAHESDAALRRLNYFNGQRLAAGDLRAEQGYHMGMRRVLNRSLYSPGIVVGLEVVPTDPASQDPQDKHRVIVRHGLAFDHLGREIFLPVDVKVQVMGAPRSAPGVVFGNLLVVSYRETRQFPAQGQCVSGAPYRPCGGDQPWGAPTRLVADAVFEFLDSWPSDDSGKIVLTQVELDDQCKVVRTSPGVRRYAVPAKPQTVRALALEGEKDIADGTGKMLHFHVDGGFPEQVLLFLRGRLFSPLYYTEVGEHHHAIALTSAAGGGIAAHSHQLDLSSIKLQDAGEHRHELWGLADDDQEGAFELGSVSKPNAKRLTGEDGFSGGVANGEIKPGGKHTHTVDASSVTATKEANNVPPHTHEVSGNSAKTGMLPAMRIGAPYTFIDDLKVLLDGKDVTQQICEQLRDRPQQASQWDKLGDGSAGHALCSPEGTGEIDLLRLGHEIGLGAHTLEFRIGAPKAGGQLQYNLYVS
jgi:hypothetical protein